MLHPLFGFTRAATPIDATTTTSSGPGAQSSGVIEFALRTQSVRTRVSTQAETLGLDAPIRMFGSILEWEKTSDSSRKKLLALKIISVYLDKGNAYEVTIFKPQTVKDMLSRKHIKSKTFFNEAKKELVNFIKNNDTLVNLITATVMPPPPAMAVTSTVAASTTTAPAALFSTVVDTRQLLIPNVGGQSATT